MPVALLPPEIVTKPVVVKLQSANAKELVPVLVEFPVIVVVPETVIVPPPEQVMPLAVVLVGAAKTREVNETVPVLLFVIKIFAATVTVFPNVILLAPRNCFEVAPIVFVPVPVLNVVPFIVMSPLIVVGTAEPVVRSKTPLEFTVMAPVNVLVVVFVPDTALRVALELIVVAPANVTATFDKLVVPDVTFKIPNPAVGAQLITDVPDVFKVVPALTVT